MILRNARRGPTRSRIPVKAFGAQIVLILIGIAVLIGWPRPDGSLLLVPTTADLPSTINLVLAHHGRIVAAAPAIGGIIVRGNAGDLAWPTAAHGTVMIGVPAALCGASTVDPRSSAA